MWNVSPRVWCVGISHLVGKVCLFMTRVVRKSSQPRWFQSVLKEGKLLFMFQLHHVLFWVDVLVGCFKGPSIIFCPLPYSLFSRFSSSVVLLSHRYSSSPRTHSIALFQNLLGCPSAYIDSCFLRQLPNIMELHKRLIRNTVVLTRGPGPTRGFSRLPRGIPDH